MFKLGDKVKSNVTGKVGILTNYHQWFDDGFEHLHYTMSYLEGQTRCMEDLYPSQIDRVLPLNAGVDIDSHRANREPGGIIDNYANRFVASQKLRDGEGYSVKNIKGHIVENLVSSHEFKIYRLGSNDPQTVEYKCNHSWKQYNGLIDSFEYCDKCDVKKTKEEA